MNFIKDGKIYVFETNKFNTNDEHISIIWNIIKNIKNFSQNEIDICYRDVLIDYNISKLKCKYK